MTLRPGTHVRMTKDCMLAMLGDCKDGIHKAAFLLIPDDPTSLACCACSIPHLIRYGNCIGILEGKVEYGPKGNPSKVGPEHYVRWLPSGRRFGYLLSELEAVPDSDLTPIPPSPGGNNLRRIQ